MCEILTSKVESSDRRYALKHLSNIELVGIKYQQGLRQLQICKEGGKLLDHYKMFGRKRYISPEEIKKIQQEIIHGGGQAIGQRDARIIIQQYAVKHLRGTNHLPSAQGGKEID
eukprot:3650746-Ditylum_brightwellii.AAC.1